MSIEYSIVSVFGRSTSVVSIFYFFAWSSLSSSFAAYIQRRRYLRPGHVPTEEKPTGLVYVFLRGLAVRNSLSLLDVWRVLTEANSPVSSKTCTIVFIGRHLEYCRRYRNKKCSFFV